MKKSIEWRIRHAKRKIAEGKKVGKYSGMLIGYDQLRRKDNNEGIYFIFRKGSELIGASYIEE